MKAIVRQAKRLRGRIDVPGDKSISHRAAIFNAIADGDATVRNFLAGEDCLATVECLRGLGVDMTLDGDVLRVHGAGLHGLQAPEGVLDCANSGTTMRLLLGLLAGQDFFSVLTGDASLRLRPMERVLSPLRSMGAEAWSREGGLAPIALRGGRLGGMTHQTPVASAQVKSALLLAGLFAQGETAVEEPGPSRDHTERMLSAMGARIETRGLTHRLTPPKQLEAIDVNVPRDFSAAAFWIVAAAAHPNAEIVLPAIGLNPTRTGLLDVLRAMGADIEVTEEHESGGEPVGDVVVRSSALHGTEVAGEVVSRLIDEVPVLAIAAAMASGRTTIRDAAELRVKESDRVMTVVRMLHAFGVEAKERPDGMMIEGRGALDGAKLASEGDHRLAMACAIGGLIASGSTTVQGAEAADVSYPGFWRDVEALSSTSTAGAR